jgi:hypothetical protein
MSLRLPTATIFELGPPSRWRRFFFFDILQGYKCSSAEMHALRRLVRGGHSFVAGHGAPA